MPSIDEKLFIDLYESGKVIVIAEQDNGFIRFHYINILFKYKKNIDKTCLIPINVLDKNGEP